MPGIGVRTGARILAEIGDASNFPTAAHPAAYAGLAPVTRRSGSSIRGETPARLGNRLLKRRFFLAAFASLSHPPSRAYYDRKTAEGKRHNQALLCPARRRCDVLYAMIRNGAFIIKPRRCKQVRRHTLNATPRSCPRPPHRSTTRPRDRPTCRDRPRAREALHD